MAKVANGYVTIRFQVCDLDVETDLLEAMFPEGYEGTVMDEDTDEITYSDYSEED